VLVAAGVDSITMPDEFSQVERRTGGELEQFETEFRKESDRR